MHICHLLFPYYRKVILVAFFLTHTKMRSAINRDSPSTANCDACCKEVLFSAFFYANDNLKSGTAD